jgi:CRP-like cAMP-binding protein
MAGMNRRFAQLRARAYAYRWGIAANTACVLQLVQWSCEDVIWIRSLNCGANVFYGACNMNMGAWAYVPWDISYTLLNIVMITRELGSRSAARAAEAEAMPFGSSRTAFERVLSSTLSKREAGALLSIASERVLAPGEELPRWHDERDGATAGCTANAASAADSVGLVISGALGVRTGGVVGMSVGPDGWYGHYSFLEPSPHPSKQVLFASEPTLVLEWGRAELAAVLAAEPQLDRGLHVLWHVDLARRLAQPRTRAESDGERAVTHARAHYLELLLAVAVSGAVSAEQVDYLRVMRVELGIDDVAHRMGLAQLQSAGAPWEVVSDLRAHDAHAPVPRKDREAQPLTMVQAICRTI